MSTCEGSPRAGAVVSVSARSIWLWAALLAVLASLPSLVVGFSSDDLSHRLALEGRAPGYAGGWFGLYDFTSPSMPAAALIKQGLFPWFTDPAVSLRFFRPLSSATLALDNALFGRNPLFAHVHSLLWMAVLAGATGRLYQRWFSAPAALASAVVFALSGVHAIPLSWLASRHTLVAASFGVLSLWAWVRLREDLFKPGLALAIVALVASLASSESGLVTVVLIAGYELGTRGLRHGLRGAVLPVGLGLCYLALYAACGYGSRGNTFYVSPFNSPLDYLTAVFWGVPALSAELFLGVPSIALSISGRSGQVLLAILGAVAAVGVVLLLRAVRTALSANSVRVLTWLSVGSFVSLLALVGAPVSGRVLPLPLVGTAAVAGHLLWGTWSKARGIVQPAAKGHPLNSPQLGSTGRQRWWMAFGVVVLFQLGVSPLMRLSVPHQFTKAGEKQKQLALTADVASCSQGGSLYIVNGSDPTLTLYAGAAILFYAPEKAGAEHLRILSMAPQAQRLSRTASGVLELEVLDAPRQNNRFEQLFRAPSHPLRVGQRIELGEVTAQVEASSADLFTRARFEFERALDSSRSCLMVWRNARLENLPFPRLGENVRIEHEPGPMGL